MGALQRRTYRVHRDAQPLANLAVAAAVEVVQLDEFALSVGQVGEGGGEPSPVFAVDQLRERICVSFVGRFDGRRSVERIGRFPACAQEFAQGNPAGDHAEPRRKGAATLKLAEGGEVASDKLQKYFGSEVLGVGRAQGNLEFASGRGDARRNQPVKTVDEVPPSRRITGDEPANQLDFVDLWFHVARPVRSGEIRSCTPLVTRSRRFVQGTDEVFLRRGQGRGRGLTRGATGGGLRASS